MYLIYDIGATNIRTGVADGETILFLRESVWPADLSGAEEVEYVAQEGRSALQAAGLQKQVKMVGVAFPALIDGKGQVLMWPNRPSWVGLHVRDQLESLLGYPVLLEEDGNAAAVGEHTFGAARGYRDFIMIVAGSGIGAGLILNGELFRGRHGWAGEIGHMVMRCDGPMCSCGRQGCLQPLASGWTMDRIAVDNGLSGACGLNLAAENGQQWAQDALTTAATWLGLAVANVCTLLDLEAAVVGGSLAKLGSVWWDALRLAVDRNLPDPARRSFTLQKAALSDKAGLYGALSLAIRGEQHAERIQCAPR